MLINFIFEICPARLANQKIDARANAAITIDAFDLESSNATAPAKNPIPAIA